MAEVYKAYHPGLDRHVAIKILHSFLAEEEDFLTRFQREARIVAAFRHPNIVQVYDFDFSAEDTLYYMVMEFIDGPNLKTRLEEMTREGQMFPPEEAIHTIAAVANALDYAHQHGMVHRDIKPANIMFAQEGEPILTDFGIARMINTASLTASGAMVGTPAYMAPEQGVGQTGDERSDIYSLGVVLYQLLTGSLPFDADTPLGIVLQHINAPLTPPTSLNPNLSSSVEAAVMRALIKDPTKRYQAAKEFAADLERCLAGEPVEPISPELVRALVASEGPRVQGQTWGWELPTLSSTPVVPLPQAAPQARPERRWIAVSVAVVALVLLGGAVLFATGIPGRLFATLLSQMATPMPSLVDTSTPTSPLDLTATYNANATQFAAWMATYEATTGVTPTPSRTPTPTPTPTPDLTATAMSACVFDMEVVGDQRVSPSVLTPRRQFVKRWTVKNTGTCPWPEEVRLVFVSGDELEIINGPEIEPLSPEGTAEIEITLRAPTGYGDYASGWQLQDSEGNSIGEKLEVICRVGPTPTPRPTATPQPTATIIPTATPLSSPTPTEPLRVDSVGIAPGTFRKLATGEWEADIYVVARGGDGQYRFYRDVISPATEFFAPAPAEPWVGVHYGARWAVCEDMWISFWVVSAGVETHWSGIIPYPEECP